MTENEARNKWRPMARAEISSCAVNRQYDSGGKPDTDCLCIASGCACWVEDRPSEGHCGLARG